MKLRFAVLLVTVVLLSSIMGGLLGGKASPAPGFAQTSPNEFLANFTEALDVVQQNYVDEVGADALVYSAIKGMLRELDPHSSFFDPTEFARMREQQHSKYYGLGILVHALLRDHGRVVIAEPPTSGSPAERCGLRAGDVITRIEGEPIDDWSLDDVVGHLKGPRGTTVNITIERPGIHDPLQFKVERDEIPLNTVRHAFMIKPGIGYVKIDRFSESTADELRKKLNELNPANLSGLILDLRDNPGGLLNQAIDVADFFLPQGDLIVSTKGRMEGSVRSYRAPGPEKIRVPVVVLINRHSASASEIVAGALQDHDRALIVGETSFGKGLVQSVYTLENDTGMALTTAKYYTPSGRLIQRDYTNSMLEYYYINTGEAANLTNKSEEREIRYTDSGRKVFGGGGITPDEIEPTPELTRFEALLTSKDIFFQYARRLTLGQVPSASSFRLPEQKDTALASNPQNVKLALNFDITDAILTDFEQFLRDRNIEFTHEDIQKNEDFIKRSIRQYVATSFYGLQEGYKIQLQGDALVLKALQMMPEAEELMKSGWTRSGAQNPTK
jgi:carboxyl-terminal processing protease